MPSRDVKSKPAHPDEKSAVTSSLNSNNLSNVSVSQDRDKGVITLTGDVNSEDQKSQAAVLAKQAAPDYTIRDEIGVRPQALRARRSPWTRISMTPSKTTTRLRSKATGIWTTRASTIRPRMARLVLKGSVKTVAQKKEAEKLAKSVPNVQQVVNEIEVKPGKHSSPNA